MIDDAITAKLAGLYLKPGRDRRDFARIEAMAAQAEASRVPAFDPEAVKAAIWFHCAVAEEADGPDRSASAALAAECLDGYADAERVDFVVRTVLAAGTLDLPAFTDERRRKDAALVIGLCLDRLEEGCRANAAPEPSRECRRNCAAAGSCRMDGRRGGRQARGKAKPGFRLPFGASGLFQRAGLTGGSCRIAAV